MNTIEFNQKYTKLPLGIKTAVLVACEPAKLQDLERRFIEYDCEHINEFGEVVYDCELWETYNKGENPDLLCLILKSDTGAIFTTLRKDNEENRQKYMGNYIGGGQFEKQRPEFNIIIKED